jgi:hypothetical protein
VEDSAADGAGQSGGWLERARAQWARKPKSVALHFPGGGPGALLLPPAPPLLRAIEGGSFTLELWCTDGGDSDGGDKDGGDKDGGDSDTGGGGSGGGGAVGGGDRGGDSGGAGGRGHGVGGTGAAAEAGGEQAEQAAAAAGAGVGGWGGARYLLGMLLGGGLGGGLGGPKLLLGRRRDGRMVFSFAGHGGDGDADADVDALVVPRLYPVPADVWVHWAAR